MSDHHCLSSISSEPRIACSLVAPSSLVILSNSGTIQGSASSSPYLSLHMDWLSALFFNERRLSAF